MRSLPGSLPRLRHLTRSKRGMPVCLTRSTQTGVRGVVLRLITPIGHLRLNHRLSTAPPTAFSAQFVALAWQRLSSVTYPKTQLSSGLP
jgi:hypothetical protein